MSASLVEFQSQAASNESVSEHERRLERVARETYTALDAAVPRGSALETLLCAWRDAEWRRGSYWERRGRGLERQLRRVLASDGFTDSAERAAVLQKLYGPDGGERDAAVLSATEREIVVTYRSLDTDDRTMIRLLLRRCATGGAK